MTTAIVKFVSTVDSKLSQLTIENGQLIFASDTRRIYLDFNNIRTEYSQIIPLVDETSREEYMAPIRGFYFVQETNCLWHYDGGWVQLTSPPKEQIVFVDYINLPSIGKEEILYITETDSYKWTPDGYVRLGGSIWEQI